jgi:hypothetical protein
MKAGATAIHGGLAAAALLAAYVTWQREPEITGVEEEAIALDLNKSDVEKVRYEDATKWVIIERRGEDVWLHTGHKPPPPPPAAAGGADGGTPGGGADGGTATAAAPPPPPPVPTSVPSTPDRELRGNELAVKLLDRFAPLKALRALGTLPPEKLKEVGLEGSARKITVHQRGGRTYELQAGTPGGPGGSSPYLQNLADKKVYLVASTLVSDLDAAGVRLVDRRLHTFKQPEPDTVVVKAGDKSRELVQTSDPSGAIKLASKKTPDKPDELTKNWADKVWRVIVTETLGKGEMPPGGEPKVEGRVEYLRNGKSLGFVDLARGSKGELYLRSEYTAGWNRAHSSADEVLGEIKKIVDAT